MKLFCAVAACVLLLSGSLMANPTAALIRLIEADDAAGIVKAVQADPSLLKASCDDQGRTALHVAASRDKPDAVQALLDVGADFYARDAIGQLPLDIPPGGTNTAARQHLRSINQGRNAFLGAVHEQKLDEVRTLLAADKSQASARDIGDGWSALMTACFHGNAELVELLLKAGAQLDAVDFNDGRDAASICADKGNAACMKLLLDAGVDPNKTCRVGYGRLPMRMTPLHVACWKGKADIVELLLSRGAEVNARAASYAVFSPLHFAATEGHADVVKQLLAANADRTAVDGRRGLTALKMAEQGKHQAVVDLLK